METILEMLRKKNPGLPLYSVTDPEFKRYGRILAGETGEQSRRKATATTHPSRCWNKSAS